LKHRLLVLMFVACIVAIPAAAGPVGVTLTGTGGVSQGGVIVAPYYLTVTGLNGGKPMAVMCDDYTHSVYVGESWSASIQTFATLSGTRFGAGAFQQYAEAAWLFTQFLANPSKAGNINFAEWYLFAPTQVAANHGGWTAGAQAWFAAAQTWFSSNCSASGKSCSGINLAQFMFITPTNLTGPGSPQEYIAMVTPEPASIALFAVGLLFLGFLTRKFSAKQASGMTL